MAGGNKFSRVKSYKATSPAQLGLDRKESKGPIQYVTNDAWLNRPQVAFGRINIPLVGDTQVQGPDVPIPDGFSVWIKALPANASDMLLAGSKADLGIALKTYLLDQGEGLELFVQNLNMVWFSGNIGDGAVFAVEQDKS